MKQQQPKNSLIILPENSLPRKYIVVNNEVWHLYSLQQMNVLDKIDTFYLVNLATHIGPTDDSKSDWIQHTQLAVYASLNRSKND